MTALADILLSVLLTEAVSVLPLFLFLRLRKKQISGYVKSLILAQKTVFFDVINEWFDDFTAQIQENPVFIEKLLEGPLSKLADKMLSKYGGQITGNVVGEVAGAVGEGFSMKMVPKEMRGIVGLLQLFRGFTGQRQGGGSQEKNPFG